MTKRHNYGNVHYKSVDLTRSDLLDYYKGKITKEDFLSHVPKYADNFDLLDLLSLLKEASDKNIWPLEIFGPRN